MIGDLGLDDQIWNTVEVGDQICKQSSKWTQIWNPSSIMMELETSRLFGPHFPCALGRKQQTEAAKKLGREEEGLGQRTTS